MPRKNNQAVRTEEIHATKEAKQRFLLKGTYVILILSLIAWGWSIVRNPNFFPLKQIVIHGQYTHCNPNAIKEILLPYVNTGLLRINVGAIQQQLQELPWIKTAVVNRNWPNKLTILLTEKIPIARWRKKALVTVDGEVFFPEIATIPTNLPSLMTPTSLIPQAIIMLEQMNVDVAVVNLKLKALILTERQTVTLVLQSKQLQNPPISFKVLLGHDAIQKRLKRFIEVFPKVFENRLNQVQYVDMRYTNGMSVKWK